METAMTPRAIVERYQVTECRGDLYREVHASTVCANGDELLCAWFGGSCERFRDTEIWMAEFNGDWGEPVRMTYTDEPCWNPVLDVDPVTGVLLYYKVGPSPSRWRGYFGQLGESRELPEPYIGPVRCKPIRTRAGTWLAGSSDEQGFRWTSCVERGTPSGEMSRPEIAGPEWRSIQPTLWQADDGRIHAYMRSLKREIIAAYSEDDGQTWSAPAFTSLPNPNSGIDAVKLTDGRVLLAYNHSPESRVPLHLAISEDDGDTWSSPTGLGNGNYPAIVQAPDGMVHLSATSNWRREITHLVIDPEAL